MSNFRSNANNQTTTYTEPEGVGFYRGQVVLSPEYRAERVGLCLTMYGGGDAVALGLMDEADVQQFLYAAAVHSKLIKDGDPLILMKSISDEEAA